MQQNFVMPRVLGVYIPEPYVRKKQKPKNNGMQKYPDQVVGEIRWLSEKEHWSFQSIADKMNVKKAYVESICVHGLRPKVDAIKPDWI